MPTIDKSLGTYHISSALSQYEQARTGFFTFTVFDIDDLVRSDFSEINPEASDLIRNGQEIITLSVMKSSVPNFEVEVMETRIGNSRIKHAGVASFSDGTIVCQDFVGLEVKDVLKAWQALAYDVINDKGGRMGDWVETLADGTTINHRGYKRNCQLAEYTQDGQMIRYWDLIGCWVSKLDEDDFDKQNDDTRQITATIPFDRAIMHKAD